MCKEMPVIPVSRVVDPKKNNRKKWRAEEEERHKVLLTHKKCNESVFFIHEFFALLRQSSEKVL
jgi:hypothetical protein